MKVYKNPPRPKGIKKPKPTPAPPKPDGVIIVRTI